MGLVLGGFPRRTLLGSSVNRGRLPPSVPVFLYAVEEKPQGQQLVALGQN
jgi:hypothetical protein